jgi:hypothetical protein
MASDARRYALLREDAINWPFFNCNMVTLQILRGVCSGRGIHQNKDPQAEIGQKSRLLKDDGDLGIIFRISYLDVEPRL